MDLELEKVLPFAQHYGICGIAKQPFNTVYQLMAQFREHPEHKDATAFLMVPDYLNFLLTGVKRNEYQREPTESYQRMLKYFHEILPDVSDKSLRKFLK